MRIAVAAGLVLIANVAAAAPIASALADLDGDGRPDAIELSSLGVLSVKGKTLDLRIKPAHARIVVTRSLIAIDVGDQAIIVGVDGGVLRELMRTPLGGVGLDQEYGTAIDARSDGLYRYQQRPGARRCDGKPAYLFAEGFDPAGKRFRKLARVPSLVDESATKLTAKPDAGALPPLVYAARLASHQPGAADAGALAIPSELDDGKPTTFWREELAGSTGEGQFFTFETRVASAKARQLRIVPGNPASAATMKSFNRPHQIAIVGDKTAYRVDLPDAANDALGTAYAIDLPEALGGCITVVLESSYGPDKGTTAIAELGVYADGERTGGGEALLAHVVAQGSEGAIGAGAALARRGAAGANAVEAEIVKTTDAATRRRLIAVLVKIQDTTAVPSLVRAMTDGWVSGPALVEVVDALARLGMVDELAELVGKGGIELEARLAAVRGIPLDAKGLPHVLALAGTGPRDVRRAVIERATLAPIDVLVAAAETATSSAASGDLWRAVTRRARTTPADRPVAVAAMTAALETARDYDRRYRLVDGLATLGDVGEIRRLDTLLRSLRPGSLASALRQVAVVGISSAPRPAALPMLLSLATDPDPGVRLAVLGALAGTETDVESPWHVADGPDGIDRVITSALSTDRWPEVRRRAASSLGLRCQRSGPASALVDAVTRDKESDVRADALISLVQCRAQGVGTLLAKLWDDSKAPIELRTQAIGLAVALGDPSLGVTLVGKFTRWRGAALESEEALRLAQAAAASISRLRSPGAAQALLDALDDSAFPEIVKSAAEALGRLGPACPAAAKTKLEAIANSDDDASVIAKRAAAQCGR